MKTPITYYGGKQTLAPLIVKLIPEHTLYCETFVGGGAVYFAKPPSKVEVINDTNGELINFYKQVKYHYPELEKKISVTLHSRQLHHDANVIYSNPHLFNEVDRAWAVWTASAQSFSGMLDGTWGYDIQRNTTSKKIRNKRDGFTFEYAVRLQDTQIESTDAIRVIRTRDRADSFFYQDPPYFNSDCGHYDGYTREDFIMLMETNTNLKGKFLMSSYPSKELAGFVKANGWDCYQKQMDVTVGAKHGNRKKKIEVFTANYSLDGALLKQNGWTVSKGV